MSLQSLTDAASQNPLEELAQKQLLKYAQDLAQIYIAEMQRREDLEIAYQAISAIFANTPDSLIVLDERNIVQRVNRAFLQLVELPEASVVGQVLSASLRSDELVQVLKNLSIKESNSFQVEIDLVEPIKRSLLVNIAPLHAGELGGWIVVLHDQTRFKRLESQKDEFINIASHELRTPLGLIQGYADMLSQEPLTEDQHGFLVPLILGVERLKLIVDELIDFAALNPGDVKVQGIKNVRLSELLDRVVGEFASEAGRKQISLVVDCSPSIELFADASLLQIACNQLVLNGINFNRQGGSVQLSAQSQAEDVELRITDTGVGIPQGDIDTIFQPFFQVQQHDTRKVGGLGLGLPLVRRSIALLGGTVAIESKLGFGTTVRIVLPLRQPSADRVALDTQIELEAARKQSLVYARDLMVLYRELQATNQQLSEFNVQLEEANKLKSNFLAMISHELRSPFATLDFALQTFGRYGLDALKSEQRELLDQLTQTINTMRQTTNNLVAYAGLISKQGRLDLAVVNIDALAAELMAILMPMAQSRGLQLISQVTPNLQVNAGDKTRISEAIWHLLHNAIKFTPAGGRIVLQARAEKEVVFIAVQDTGVGIPADQQTRLWESFAQLSDSLKRGVEGLGLGLSLVRYVAAAHGGDVVLRSEIGKGSLIGFWLPNHSQAKIES